MFMAVTTGCGFDEMLYSGEEYCNEIRRPGKTPMGPSVYSDDDSSSMTRPDGVRYRKA